MKYRVGDKFIFVFETRNKNRFFCNMVIEEINVGIAHIRDEYNISHYIQLPLPTKENRDITGGYFIPDSINCLLSEI